MGLPPRTFPFLPSGPSRRTRRTTPAPATPGDGDPADGGPARRPAAPAVILTAVAALTTLAALITLVGCGALSPRERDIRPGPTGRPAVITVPGDTPSIQAALDAAVPGDLVLVGPGVYRESPVLRTPRVVLRGSDRGTVIIDGEHRRATGVTVLAEETAVENLTLRGHTTSGLTVVGTTGRPLLGYRASYLTVHDNGRHGIRAVHAGRGVIEHSHVSGHGHAGIRVEHCDPCESVVRDNVTEANTIGIELVATGHPMTVRGNTGERNTAGVRARARTADDPGPIILGNILPDAPRPSEDVRALAPAPAPPFAAPAAAPPHEPPAEQPQRPGDPAGPPRPAVGIPEQHP
ncbi:nitrous oxide reductase family maturation protein NosD [Streptomyces sp. ST2-7A]|uniref:right-handed parallel beta-helix repeat-containing protein n=1 Tax=Streptomyces sp. ST2-7A TaxID=2907214 RepID=UPI001F2D41D4|nr:right-handed parallel beta-helix repeat-containing protein [Streptomyces sp. ST2-7A]MCE7080097.1 right-handed parallel beta-helix repeat-containing protein [Streptomyces sp. ST2-7A]